MPTEREIAVRGLIDIFDKKSYSNVALRRILEKAPHLSRVQRAFVTELVAGCIRHLTFIDHIIGNSSNIPFSHIKPEVLNILRISVYQAGFMDKVPRYAICNEAVKLTKKMGHAHAASFVNAMLRSVVSRGVDVKFGKTFIDYSCNKWIVEHFTKELGDHETIKLLEICNMPPEITIAVNTKVISPDELKKVLEDEGLSAEHAALVPNALIIKKTADIANLESFKKGLYHVMDQAAIAAVNCALLEVDSNVYDYRIIDVCSAPGGKSFLASYLAGNAQILARDIHDHKLDMLAQGAKRLNANINTQKWDATVFDEKLEGLFDLVIADVPCSGLGTLRRRPDIKHFKEKQSLTELVSLQRHILESCWRYVKPGGKLLYSTCTINNKENIENADWFLVNHPFEYVDFSQGLPDIAAFKLAGSGHVQILPQHYGTDGFFIALFERRVE